MRGKAVTHCRWRLLRWRDTRRNRWRHKLHNLGQVDFRQGDFLVGREPEQRRQECCGTSQSYPRSPQPLRLLPSVIGDHLFDDLR